MLSKTYPTGSLSFSLSLCLSLSLSLFLSLAAHLSVSDERGGEGRPIALHRSKWPQQKVPPNKDHFATFARYSFDVLPRRQYLLSSIVDCLQFQNLVVLNLMSPVRTNPIVPLSISLISVACVWRVCCVCVFDRESLLPIRLQPIVSGVRAAHKLHLQHDWCESTTTKWKHTKSIHFQ